jgi:hypothetical protein
MSRFAVALVLSIPVAAAAAPGALGSIEEFAGAVAMKRGGWHTTVRVTAADVGPSPTADPAKLATARARIQSQVGVVTERDECVGPASEGPRLPGILIEPRCSFSRLQAADGRWTLDSSCRSLEGVEMGSLTSAGTYSPEKVTGRHEGVISHEGVVVHLEAETESRYIGE